MLTIPSVELLLKKVVALNIKECAMRTFISILVTLLLLPSVVVGQTRSTWTAVSASDVTDTTITTLKAAVASTRHYLNLCTISNMHASTATRVDILDASTVIFQCPAAAAGGGCVVPFGGYPLSGNSALRFQAGTTGAAIRVSCMGFSTLE